MFDGFQEFDYKNKEGLTIHYGHNFDHPSTTKEQTLIFNYGLVCNVAHWKHQIPYFHKLGYRVLFHDYRFHYKSSSTAKIEDLNFEKISYDMCELFESLNISSAIHLGHSMGVNTTLEYAHRYKDQVDAMVLISGTVLPPQDVLFDSNWMELIQPILETLLQKYPKFYKSIWSTGHLNPLAIKLIHSGGFNTKKVPTDFVEYYLKKIGELSPEVFFQLLKEMKNHTIVTALETIQTPALIMGGDKDQVIPNFLQTILKDHLPQSKLYVIKDGSHVPQVDFPDSVNERIELFMRRLKT